MKDSGFKFRAFTILLAMLMIITALPMSVSAADVTPPVLEATEIQKHCAQLVTLSDIQLCASDTDNDTVVTVLDATQIQKLVAKLIEKF